MLALLLGTLLNTAGAQEGATTLVLEIEGVGSTQGQLLVAVYDTADGFPGRSELAVARRVVAPAAPRTIVTFEGLRPGTYAAVAVHDLDGDGVLDTRPVIPIPTEPFGTSRDVRARFGPPKFADAAFVTDAGRHVERFVLTAM